ncbi:hypothetical protein [Spirosoma arboris]|nr:hypothetical protein [Spirosoma arboris]
MAIYTQQFEEFFQDVLISIHASIRDLEEKKRSQTETPNRI